MIQNANKIVLGTAQMGLDYGINNKNGKIPLEQSDKILNKAYESGIKFLDTAQVYGEAHKVIGEFHKTNPTTKFKINTKIPNNIDLNKLANFFNHESFYKTIKKGRIFYRCRISDKTGFTTNQMGNPPNELATGGRANPKGISSGIFLALAPLIYSLRLSMV